MSLKLELKGIEGVAAYRVYQIVLLTYYMMPLESFKSYEEFLQDYHNRDDDGKRDIFVKALTLGEFKPEEVQTLLRFYDIPKEQINGLEVDEIINKCAEVLLEISKLKVFF